MSALYRLSIIVLVSGFQIVLAEIDDHSIDLCLVTIGHFRVPLCLCFNASLSTKPFLWKWLLICMKIKLHVELIFALRLVLKGRHKRTRNWPIDLYYQVVALFLINRRYKFSDLEIQIIILSTSLNITLYFSKVTWLANYIFFHGYSCCLSASMFACCWDRMFLTWFSAPVASKFFHFKVQIKLMACLFTLKYNVV